MAQAFILRRGGSGVADLTMIGSQTCPATPNPNTLWLYTQTALKRMVIQPAQPTTLEGGAAAGDVWLRSGGGGPVLLQHRGLAYAVIAAYVYTGSVWALTPAQYYNGKGWTPAGAALLDGANQYAGLTGGWQKTNCVGDGGGVTFPNTNAMRLQTVEAIDLTPFNTLQFVGSMVNYWDYSVPTLLGVTAVNGGALTGAKLAQNDLYYTATVDVAAMKGNYYVGMSGRQTGSVNRVLLT